MEEIIIDRTKRIIKVSIKGIILNVLLSTSKAIAGVMANSIAVILDAVNNLSDVISQVITIIGTKISTKKPDKEHPYGHGRIEYITSVILAIILILTGVTSITESINKIIVPVTTEYTIITFIVIILGIIAKFIFGKYVSKIGKQIESGSLIAMGKDSFLDSILTFSTLVTALLSKYYGISLEGIVGVILSLLIVKAGYEVLIDALSSIIGTRIDGNVSRKLKEKINSYPQVNGTYDLILHNYGPIKTIGSVHIEVDDNMTAKEIHALSKKIQEDMYEEFKIILTIGIYASNTDDNEYVKIKNSIKETLKKYPQVLQMHGFYVNSKIKNVTFDIVIDFKEREQKHLKEQIENELHDIYNDFKFDIIIDNDYSD